MENRAAWLILGVFIGMVIGALLVGVGAELVLTGDQAETQDAIEGLAESQEDAARRLDSMSDSLAPLEELADAQEETRRHLDLIAGVLTTIEDAVGRLEAAGGEGSAIPVWVEGTSQSDAQQLFEDCFSERLGAMGPLMMDGSLDGQSFQGLIEEIADEMGADYVVATRMMGVIFGCWR